MAAGPRPNEAFLPAQERPGSHFTTPLVRARPATTLFRWKVALPPAIRDEAIARPEEFAWRSSARVPPNTPPRKLMTNYPVILLTNTREWCMIMHDP